MSASYISAQLSGSDVIVWERSDQGRKMVKYPAPWFFYYEDPEGEHTSIYGNKVKYIDFKNPAEFYTARKHYKNQGIKTFESDVNPVQKVMALHYYNIPAPKLNVSFLDIEVDYDKKLGFSTTTNPYAPINSISIAHLWSDTYTLFAVPPPNWDGVLDETLKELSTITICKDEKELLQRLILEIENSDVLCGWNSSLFDMPYIAKRIEKVLGEKELTKLSFPCAKKPVYETVKVFGKDQLKINTFGRVCLDYLDLFKKFEMSARPSYKLERIADDELPDLPKLKYEGTLADLYIKDFNYFMRYNIRDTECLMGFERKQGYVQLANELYHESTGQAQDVLGTIALAQLSIRNFCNYELDMIISDTPESSGSTEKAQGAYVLKPKVGKHEMIGSVDITSLYPSVIMSLNISPEKLIGQFIAEEHAHEQIIKRSSIELTAEMLDRVSDTITQVTKTAADWHQYLLDNNQAISGFGTIFCQKELGVIPAVLQMWFDKRKEYKGLKSKAAKNGDEALVGFYDRMQYCYKIKLNSLYGALLNEYFKFYDRRLGSSVTAGGRLVLTHQCAASNEILTDVYDAFGEKVLYGDSVAGDTKIDTCIGIQNIEDLFKSVDDIDGTKEYHLPDNLQTRTFNKRTWQCCMRPIKYVMRHKCSKKMYRVWTSDTQFVDVTEDHSLMGMVATGDWGERTPEKVTAEQLIMDRCIELIVPNNINSIDTIKVKLIEEIEFDDYVYDIEVEDTHTFFGNGLLLHNTDSTYFGTGADNIEDATLIANYVGNQVNKGFPDFMEETFLCKGDYKFKMACEREIVASSGIFVTPKRYILRILDEDGKKVDKLKIMGLDTKKTIIPVFIQKKLNGYFGRFLRGEDWDSVERDVVSYKKELLASDDITSFGIPIGINNLEDYTAKWQYDPSETLPGHVRASIYYNEKLREHGDVESIKIVSGMRIKKFYLKNPEGKFNSIAIPGDLESIPEWFNETIIVDKEKSVEKLIDNPLRNVLKAIGLTPPTQQSLHIKDELEF